MRCCAPFCRNAPDIVPSSQDWKRVSFHGFPSDASLCAAWLRALGKQDAALTDPAVVCSQHFLEDDICETENGLRQIDAGAIPSTVLVCMMCLDTDSKLFLMRKHKLEEAYEYLTGYAPCNVGNLKQTLCVQCAQRLMNFSRFRDRSLRARALMMDLVEKHELITRRHIKMINRTKYKLKSSMVVTTQGANFCDLHIQEDTSEDKHTESETTIDTGVVKTEESDDSVAVSEDMDVICKDDDYADNINNGINENYYNADSVNNGINENYYNADSVNNGINENYYNADSVKNGINEDYYNDDSVKNRINEDYYNADSVKNGINEDYYNDDSVKNRINEDYNNADSVNNAIDEEYCNTDSRKDMDVIYEGDNADSVTSDYVALHEENISDDSIMLSAKLLDEALLKALQKKPASVDQLLDLVKSESVDFKCSLCSEELVEEFAYVKHMKIHAQSGTASGESGTAAGESVTAAGESVTAAGESGTAAVESGTARTFVRRAAVSGRSLPSLAEIKSRTARPRAGPVAKTTPVAPLCARVAIGADGEEHLTEGADAGPSSERAVAIISGDLDDQSCDNNNTTNDNIDRYTNCIVKLYDVFGKKPMPKRDASLAKTRKVIISCDSQKFAFKKKSFKSIQNEFSTKEYTEPALVKEQVDIPVSLQSKATSMFKQKSLLVKHVQSHETVNRFTCDICQYKCKYKCYLTRHMRTHTGKKLYSCNVCDYKSPRKLNLKLHTRIHTGEKPYSCRLCEYKSALKFDFKVHMSSHTGEKPYSCNVCDYKSARKFDFNVHTRKHTGEKPFSCRLCEYKSASKNLLIAHMGKHTAEKPHSCKVCEYKTLYNSDLKRHMRKHTGEKPHSCKVCEYKTAHKSVLKRHMRKHTGEKPYSCKVCEYKTAYKSVLKRHMRKHTGEKPHSCKVCEYKTEHKSVLKRHMRKHTGEKPHSCKVCEYKTEHKSVLKRHMRKHTGEKPLRTGCASINLHVNLISKIHMRSHTGEKPHSCKVCEY